MDNMPDIQDIQNIQENNIQSSLIRDTKSVCPICLKTIDAHLVEQNEGIYLVKKCQEHGPFSTRVWYGEPHYFDWTRKQIEHYTPKTLRPLHLSQKPCPQNCGLCPEHKQSTCTVLLELTDLCNLSCPICFANSKKISPKAFSKVSSKVSSGKIYLKDIDEAQKQTTDNAHYDSTKLKFQNLETIYDQLEWIAKNAGKVILQLSGGEPTLYPHLIQVVEKASQLFPAVQLNTNGILLAQDINLVKALQKAGLSWVFLQFDGDCDETHFTLRGQKLNHIKKLAIENCKQVGISVVLVSVLVRGINDHKIDTLLDFALEHFPTVRGLHFQPMTKSGRNQKSSLEHITLPEVISLLADQSKGQIKREHATAPDCEHTMCAFHARYFIDENHRLQYIHNTQKNIPPHTNIQPHANIQSHADLKAHPITKNTQQILEEAPSRSIDAVIRAWKGEHANTSPLAPKKLGSDIQEGKDTHLNPENQKLDAFDIFIEKAKKQIFSITCMAFQDVHTLDLQRLQQCCIHIYAQKNGKHALIPFCAYNLTSVNGDTLHRNT